jgi:hypothetical protein
MRKIILATILFTSLVNYVIAQSWSPVGPGIGSDYDNSVRSLATYNGELYACGSFNISGNVAATNIAKWNGNSWSAVGNGIGSEVYSLKVYNGELCAGGSFVTAGDVDANGIARWNGTNWSAIESAYGNEIRSLEVYNGDLYAAGYFPSLGGPVGASIAKWNGNTWTSADPQDSLYIISVDCMTIYNGELYVAGAYYSIGGGGVPEFFRIIKWDGVNWSNLITMPASYTLDGALGNILNMTVYNGELYVAGTFAMMIDSATTAFQIAKWNGINWSVVGSGINLNAYPLGGDSDASGYSFVKSLAVYNGSLYAGGHFDSCGTVATRNIAKWNGTNWSALDQGVNGYVYNMLGTDTALIVGGWFNYVNGNLEAHNIAKWEDTIDTCIAIPSSPVAINGPDSVCNGTTQTYWVSSVNNASSYTWNLPQGWTGNSTSTSITVSSVSNGGIIFVTANNSCGNSSPQTLTVTIKPVPASPLLLNGKDSICEGMSQIYFVDPVPGATGYEWFVPYDWSGYSTMDTISIIAYGFNGELSVSAYNDCGSSSPQVLPITVSPLPHTPDYIEGDTRVCKGTSHLYFVQQAEEPGEYTWLLPTGWNGNSNTDSIIAVAGNNSGPIYVKANNGCGSSSYQSVQITTDSIPHKPGNINGNIYTYTNYSTYYSIDKIKGATGYNWSAGDGIIQIGLPNNNISAMWKKAGTYELSVKAVNNCGIGEEQKLIIHVSDFNADDPFDINIYPNPSDGVFNLNAKRIQDKLIRVEVLTISGQPVYNSGNKAGSNDYSQFIDLQRLPQGIYIVKIGLNDKVYTRKIVKNN